MGIFKRIFGKGDEESDEKAEQSFEQVKSGEFSKVYPILKPGDWIGVKSGCLKQTLLGTPEAPQLVVGFGYDTPSNFVFLTVKDLEGKDPAQILKDAYENLENFPSEFEVSTIVEGKILTASGKDFSAEKILCKSHMLKAHQLLDATEILVSIPRRRCMMVMSKQADRDLINMFLALHADAWGDDSYGNAPIINCLFVLADGEISGIIPLDNQPQ